MRLMNPLQRLSMTELFALPARISQNAVCYQLEHTILYSYIRSLANHEPSISNYFFRESAIRRKLARFSPSVVNPILMAGVKGRLRGKLERTLEQIGLRHKWYKNAQSSSLRSDQH